MDRHPLILTARMGYAARGAVYVIIGYLALLAALGAGGQTGGAKDALRSLLGEPLGQILLILVGTGLIGYAGWRFVQSLFDADDHGTDLKGIAVRGGLLVSAITHSGLALWAFGLAFGTSWSGRSGGDSQEWTAWLMSQPYGQWLVALVAVAVAGAGIAHLAKGWRADFKKWFDMDRVTIGWISPVCRFGLMARGVVLLLIAGFLSTAALWSQSERAKGLGGVLDTLRQQPYGPFLLGVTALGLFAFGLYSLIEAVYRRITGPTT